MVQIVQGSNIGENLGQGIGEALQMLAQNRLNQLNQRATAQGLGAIPGISPEMAQSLSLLPKELIHPIIKKQLDAPGEQAYSQALSQLLGGERLQNEVPGTGLGEPKSNIPLQGLNSKQATDLANIYFKTSDAQQKQQLIKQESIDKTNKSWNDSIQKSLTMADQIKNATSRMRELLATGKVSYGLLGAYTPTQLLNEESREYDAIGDELANLLASAGSGVATNFKIKLNKNMKPNINQPLKTQENLLNRIDASADKILNIGNIRDELISQNNGNQPANLGSLVRRKYLEGLKQSKNTARETIESIDEVIQQLSQNNAPIGTEVEDDEGNTLYWNGKELSPEKP